MIISIEGNEGTIKSSILYSGPLPLVCCAFDAGSVRALYGANHKFFEGIDVQIVTYPHLFAGMPYDISIREQVTKFWKRNDGKAITIYMLPVPIQVGNKLTGLISLWTAFKRIFDWAIVDEEIHTIGIDTGTIMRRVAVAAHLEGVQNTPAGKDRVQLIQIEYGRPNDVCRAIYAMAQNVCERSALEGKVKNLVITHHLEGVYLNKTNPQTGLTESVPVLKPNGEQKEEIAGLNDTYRYVDVAVRNTKGLVAGKPGQLATSIETEFLKCGYDLSLEHTKLINPLWDDIVEAVNTNLHPTMKVKKRDE